MDSETLISYAKDLGIELREDKASLMMKYANRVIEKNSSINLTSITDENEFIIKHIIDSITVAVHTEMKGRILDVGTGGGFPGVILKIFNPENEIVLLDSVKKKLLAVEEICKELTICVTTVHKRSEEYAHEADRETFDCVVARAVAPMPKLLELCLPLVKVTGHFIAMKGPNVSSEIYEASDVEELLGARLKKQISLQLPKEVGRTLVIYEKIKNTPKGFPRTPKRIKNEPIKSMQS